MGSLDLICYQINLLGAQKMCRRRRVCMPNLKEKKNEQPSRISLLQNELGGVTKHVPLGQV